MDFTLKTYQKLLKNFLAKKYQFLPFALFLEQQQNNSTTQQINKSTNQQQIILRHDVDRLPQNALQTAKIEYELGIKGTYYFRIVPESYNPKIMEQIAALGHEIGYHYEDLDMILKKNKSLKMKLFKEKSRDANLELLISQLIDIAYESFLKNLEILRQNFNIKTICMHGSPLSPLDNKLIWTKYDYKKLGILGEPYFDIDWHRFEYYTDTGRRWNSNRSNIRDKVQSKNNINVKSTKELIRNIELLSNKLMINVHPERWNNNFLKWFECYLNQNLKNIFKVIYRNINLVVPINKNYI